jgi:hypothetical protein
MIGTALRVVVGSALVAALSAPDVARGAFGVGVLRRDGVIIPFATFDGKRWRNSWPLPQLELTVPVNVDSVPSRWWGPTGPLDAWQAWIGGAAHALRVAQPDWVNVHCARHIGLRTDYRAAGVAPPPTAQPYPKDGIAVAPPQAVEAIEIVPSEAPATRQVVRALQAAFNRAERETANRYGHPIKPRARDGVEPIIERMYGFGDVPRVFYVEAVRAYRKLGQDADDCTVAFGTGWFVQEGDVFRSLAMTVDLLDCARRQASYMLPLGAIRAAGRLFWLAQFSGWDHERYVVIEITPKQVEALVSVWGGGC